MSENLLEKCPYIGNLPGTLVTHYKGDRIDIELDSGMPDKGGWMYVYDAGNDNKFTGPEDQIFLYDTKRIPEGTCSIIREDRKDLRDDADRYVGRIEMEKMRIIRWFAREFLSHASSREDLPPQSGSHFLGRWREFTRERSTVGFKAHDFDWFCLGPNGERRKVDPELMIDEKSYPEGMRVLRKANQIAHHIFDADDHQLASLSDIEFHISLCRSYGRSCGILDKYPLWVALKDTIDRITNPCEIEGNLDHFPQLIDGLENFVNSLDAGEKRAEGYEEFAPVEKQFQFPDRGIFAEEYAQQHVQECVADDSLLQFPQSQCNP